MPLVKFKYSNGGFNNGEVASFDLTTCKRLVNEKVAVFYEPESNKKVENKPDESATEDSKDSAKTDRKTLKRRTRQSTAEASESNYQTKSE